MPEKIDRREFVRRTAKWGASIALGAAALDGLVDGPPAARAAGGVTIIAAESDDYAKAAVKAVAELGGMKKFVPKGSKVAVLANVQSKHPGTYTKPEILRAVLRMCREAGAAEVSVLSQAAPKAWDDLGMTELIKAEGAVLRLFERDGEHFRTVPIPGGKGLTEARILSAVLESDVFINMPVTKDHAGTRFTGAMKNLMGLSSGPTNRIFHKANWKTDPADIAHLDQCIVDLNKVVRPALNVVDATEFITTNGPFGPGELMKPRQVVAGADRVAVDAYCCTLWGLKPNEIGVVGLGAEQGMNPGKVKARRVKA